MIRPVRKVSEDMLTTSTSHVQCQKWNCYCGWKYAFMAGGHGFETPRYQNGTNSTGAECMGLMYAFSVLVVFQPEMDDKVGAVHDFGLLRSFCCVLARNVFAVTIMKPPCGTSFRKCCGPSASLQWWLPCSVRRMDCGCYPWTTLHGAFTHSQLGLGFSHF